MTSLDYICKSIDMPFLSPTFYTYAFRRNANDKPFLNDFAYIPKTFN